VLSSAVQLSVLSPELLFALPSPTLHFLLKENGNSNIEDDIEKVLDNSILNAVLTGGTVQ
jgi:hypothetical protein